MSGKHLRKGGNKRSLVTAPSHVDEQTEAKRREVDHIEEDLERVERELIAGAELEQTASVGHSEGDELDFIIFDLLESNGKRRTETTEAASGSGSGVAPATASEAAPADEPADEPAVEPFLIPPPSPPWLSSPVSPVASSSQELDVASALTLADVAPFDSIVFDDIPEPTQEPELSEVSIPVPPPTEELPPAPAAGFPAPFIIEPVRRRPVWPLVICAIAVFIVATGGLTLFARGLMADQLEKREAIQQEANGYLDNSIALIQEADSVIVELDRAVENQIAEEDLPRLEALLDQVDNTQGTLDKAIEQAVLAQETFLGAEDRGLAGYAREAAEYRKQMLEISALLADYDISAMRAALDLEYAWTLIVDADANMRSAVEVTAWGAVTESRDYNQEAVNKLVLAEEALGLATEVFPQADLTVLLTYLSTKKASAELALASDQAWLDGDYTTAYDKNEEFIAKDAEAVELAGAIPSDPLSLVVTVYEELTRQLREDYKLVRSQAAEADEHLRAYLGVDIRQDDGTDENAGDAAGTGAGDAGDAGAGDAGGGTAEDTDNAEGA